MGVHGIHWELWQLQKVMKYWGIVGEMKINGKC